jgi:Cu(I)/Ag(I) efflux system membrane fusion protein
MNAAIQRPTPRQRSYLAAAAIAIVGAMAGYGLSLLGNTSSSDGGGSDTACTNVLYWYDPMVPGQQFDEPGKSPFMDMQLVAKCADGGAQDANAVSIDPSIIQNFGIRTAVAEFGVLEPDITVTGTLAYNGGNVSVVQPRAGGYVQRTYNRAPQDVVARGAPIVDLLVPEWGGAQQEYLAVAATDDQALAQAARERLRLLGMSDSLIGAVARSGRPQSTITITAPQSGAITMLGVRSGMTVAAGQTLAEISGYSPIWLEAAVPEALAENARVGRPVNATLTAFPGERFAGRIIAVLPSAQNASRTITVRAAIPNPGLRLKPGMFAQVSLAPERREALLVPSEAIIRTGERTLVMIALAKGGYRPAEVRIGREANGQTEVLQGLAAGEKVITSGQFLLDSEASLTGINIRKIDEVPQMGSSTAKSEAQDKTQTYRAAGMIQKISATSVTLKHGPVPALEWPAMTMAFALSDPLLLRGLKRGDRVTFTFAQASTGPRLMSIMKAAK